MNRIRANGLDFAYLPRSGRGHARRIANSTSQSNAGSRQASGRAPWKDHAKCRRFPGIEIVAHEIELLARQIERSLAEQQA
jgi:hypothetical protein